MNAIPKVVFFLTLKTTDGWPETLIARIGCGVVVGLIVVGRRSMAGDEVRVPTQQGSW